MELWISRHARKFVSGFSEHQNLRKTVGEFRLRIGEREAPRLSAAIFITDFYYFWLFLIAGWKTKALRASASFHLRLKSITRLWRNVRFPSLNAADDKMHLPWRQQAVRNKCFHPTGEFTEIQ